MIVSLLSAFHASLIDFVPFKREAPSTDSFIVRPSVSPFVCMCPIFPWNTFSLTSCRQVCDASKVSSPEPFSFSAKKTSRAEGVTTEAGGVTTEARSCGQPVKVISFTRLSGPR